MFDHFYLLDLLCFVKMSRERTLKNRIISIIPLYVSKECPAYYELKQAIEGQIK